MMMAGVQEARSDKPGLAVSPSGNYNILASVATRAGNFGCEFWIHATYDFAKKNKAGTVNTRVADTALNTIFADPRWLILTVSCEAMLLNVIVTHAPVYEAGEEAHKQHWKTLYDQQCHLLKNAPTIWFTDANVEPLPNYMSVTGPIAQQRNDETAMYFHKALHDHHASLPSTNDEYCTNGSKQQSCIANQNHKKIDHVAVTNDVVVKQGSYQVLENFNMENQKDDHLPVIVTVMLARANIKNATRQRTLRYDRELLKQKSKRCNKNLNSACHLPHAHRHIPNLPVHSTCLTLLCRRSCPKLRQKRDLNYGTKTSANTRKCCSNRKLLT